jgi:hypothetical protein
MRTVVLLAALLWHAAALADCTPLGMDRVGLTALKISNWKVDDDVQRQQIALGMLACLRDPDPLLRDQIGFEAIGHWMRADKLTIATVNTMRVALLAQLKSPDTAGFAQPFAALALAEVARVDRLHPFLNTQDRATLVGAASSFLQGVRDYRGFDQQAGWRHGVAHGADLMLQLSLNPALGKAEHETILAAIASQIVAHDSHFYVYGEGERLSAPVFYLSRRDALKAADWERWFNSVQSLYDPKAPISQATLAQRHNVRAFLLALHAALADSATPVQRNMMLPFVTGVLKALD